MTNREDEYDYLFKGEWLFIFLARKLIFFHPHTEPNTCEQVSFDAEVLWPNIKVL